MRLRLGTVLAIVALLALAPAHAAMVELHSIQFPEKRDVRLSFVTTPIAPTARVLADVTYRQGQAQIELGFDAMKPAILFGGDVTCFVAWAVTRDGQVENLGELVTRKPSGKSTFATGKKNFALMITAEPYYLVNQPSEMLAFYNKPSVMSQAFSTPFSFGGFTPAPRHGSDGISHLLWDSKVPLELLQARKAFELATRNRAAEHADRIYAEAGAALRSANEIASTAPKSRELLDHARHAVALSNEALNISLHRIEALELERQLAARRAETEALEHRAAEAEALTAEAEALAAEVHVERVRTLAEIQAMRGEMAALGVERDGLRGQSERLTQEKSTLEFEAMRLLEERAQIATDARKLRDERDALQGRLQGALSHVADTQQEVRGLVVNLPDILFDVDQDTLKPGAQVVLAKLAGILLLMPEQSALIEGHTDASGDPNYNVNLSQRRATEVLRFMENQGIDRRRLEAMGYGMQRPVGDNTTAEGRRANRRVDIVISDVGQALAAR